MDSKAFRVFCDDSLDKELQRLKEEGDESGERRGRERMRVERGGESEGGESEGGESEGGESEGWESE